MKYYKISNEKRIRYLGYILVARAYFIKILNYVLGRNDWHYRTPYGLRGYQKLVRDILKSFPKDNIIVFDYGCGHGLLSKNYKRILFDIDSKISIYHSKEKVISLKEEIETHVDIQGEKQLISLFLNWPHGLSDSDFAMELKWLFELGSKYIITDLLFINYRIEKLACNHLIFKGDSDRDILLLWE